VPRPGGTEEEDGVVLVQHMGADGRSSLVVLDAASWVEVGGRIGVEGGLRALTRAGRRGDLLDAASWTGGAAVCLVFSSVDCPCLNCWCS